MTVNLPLLFFGLFLLCFPRQWMRLGVSVGPRRRRSSSTRNFEDPQSQREPGDPRIRFHEFAKVRNYFDLLRAGVGGLAIIGGVGIPASIALAETGTRIPDWQLLVLKLGIVCVGLLIQTVRYERRHVAFYAPIFFVAGLTVSLCGPWGALFAFLLVWAVNPMLPNSEAFLSLYSLAAAVFGQLFHEVGRILPVAATVLCFLPVFLSLLARRPLMVLTRKAVRTAGTEL